MTGETKTMAVNLTDEDMAALDALAPEPGGWIVGNGQATRWRTWRDGMPSWTDDQAQATRYARRVDAEEAHREDDDAWRVVFFDPAKPDAKEGGKWKPATS